MAERQSYSRWVHRVQPELQYELFVCNGKRNVKALKTSMYNDLNDLGRHAYYIVDRDFDDLEGFYNINNVFMLDKYSFENYLVCPVVLDSILAVEFSCNGYPDLRKRICDIFATDYESFLRSLQALNRRIYLDRRLAFDIDDLIPLSFANLVSVSIGSVTALNFDPEQILPFADQPTAEQIAALDAVFASLPPADRYRGKFALKFFRAWLDCLVSEVKAPTIGLFAAVEEQALSVRHDELTIGGFAARSKLPPTFDEFVRQIAANESV